MKDELARSSSSPFRGSRRVGATLRFARGLHLVGGHILVEVARLTRNRRRLRGYNNAESSVVVVSVPPCAGAKRYVVRVVHKANELARMTGLVDSGADPSRASPVPRRVGRSPSLSHLAWCIPCSRLPHGTDAPLPSKSRARAQGRPRDGRLRAKLRAFSLEVRGTDPPSAIRTQSDSISAMGRLRPLRPGAPRTSQARGSANRLANFDDTNLRRSARAAVCRCSRRARLRILEMTCPLTCSGEPAPPVQAGLLEELGKHTNPPLTKDAVAGPDPRLLALADKVAHERGIPIQNPRSPSTCSKKTKDFASVTFGPSSNEYPTCEFLNWGVKAKSLSGVN